MWALVDDTGVRIKGTEQTIRFAFLVNKLPKEEFIDIFPIFNYDYLKREYFIHPVGILRLIHL